MPSKMKAKFNSEIETYITRAGQCPACMAQGYLNYSDKTRKDGEYIYYPFECGECHFIGMECYELTYVGSIDLR